MNVVVIANNSQPVVVQPPAVHPASPWRFDATTCKWYEKALAAGAPGAAAAEAEAPPAGTKRCYRAGMANVAALCVADTVPGAACKACPSGLSSRLAPTRQPTQPWAEGTRCDACLPGKFTTVGAHGLADATAAEGAACPSGWGGSYAHGSFTHWHPVPGRAFGMADTSETVFTDATARYSRMSGGSVGCVACPSGWYRSTARPCRTGCPGKAARR